MTVMSSFLIGALALMAGIHAADTVVRPDYIILDYTSTTIQTDDTYSKELCFYVNFKSNWTMTSTHWSFFVSLDKISKYKGFGDANYDLTLDNPFPGTVTARAYAKDSASGTVKPGGSFKVTVCADKLTPKDNLSTQTLRAQALLSIGTSAYPSPIDLTESYLEPIPSATVCPPAWGDLADYNVYASGIISVTLSDIAGTQTSKVTSLTTLMATQSQWLSGLTASGVVGWRGSPDYKLQLLFPTDATVATFTIDGTVLPTNKFTFEILNSAVASKMTYIIFNIKGASVNFWLSNGGIFETSASKVIYNFPEATSLSLQPATIYGTVVAPSATVSISTASITGKLFAATVTGSGLTTGDQAWAGMSAVGCADCAPDFYGPTCTACSCKSNQECSDGVAGTGECTCLPGWDEACLDCAENRYGPLCDKVCNSTCLTRGECNDGMMGDGSCINCIAPWGGENCADCADGFWGSKCQNECSATLDCSGRGECNDGLLGDGTCNCTTGWGGAKCDECDNAHYGPNCEFSCTETCATRGTCSSGFDGTGECLSCGEIFVGDECEGCVDYRSGDDCDECPSGMYGDKCDKQCSETCLANGYCDQGPDGTGRCTCKTGWTGSQCADVDEGNADVLRLATSLAAILIAAVAYMFV